MKCLFSLVPSKLLRFSSMFSETIGMSSYFYLIVVESLITKPRVWILMHSLVYICIYIFFSLVFWLFTMHGCWCITLYMFFSKSTNKILWYLYLETFSYYFVILILDLCFELLLNDCLSARLSYCTSNNLLGFIRVLFLAVGKLIASDIMEMMGIFIRDKEKEKFLAQNLQRVM